MNPKYVPYRNPKILKFANGQPCQHCGLQDGSVVAAHSNASHHGKGLGKKADDIFVSYLCHKCHSAYDLKTLKGGLRAFTQEDFDRAMFKTMKLLLTNGVIG